MAEIFPRWTNRAPAVLAAGAGLLGLLVPLGVWYYFSPEYTDVGYRPPQPVDFSHRLHAGELRIDCRYCHVSVETSPVASLPSTRICMNCHQLVATRAESLAPLRESLESSEPMRWIRVHKLPDYAYFDHRSHLAAGIACASCHGDVARMERLQQVEPLSMGWCLDCHRDPRGRTVPPHLVTGPAARPPADLAAFFGGDGDPELAPPTDCSGCHR